MSPVLRPALVFAFASALALLSMPGCSQQGEGERCDAVKNGNDDCESGLVCVSHSLLLDQVTDRCCPAEGTGSDKRCTRGTAASSSTTSGGTSSTSGGTTSDAGGAPSDTGGTTSDSGGTTSDAGGTASDAGGTASDAGGMGAAGGVGASAG
jgi:hypothetical protein